MILRHVVLLLHVLAIPLIRAILTQDILQFSKQALDHWHLQKLTIIGLWQSDDSTRNEINQEMLVRSSPSVRFLSSKDMKVSPQDLKADAHLGLVIINSKEIGLIEQVSSGLRETLTWFVPEDTDLSNLKLRMDSNLYLYSPMLDNNGILIHEEYSTKNGPLIKKSIGYWTKKHGLMFNEVNMFERRKDMSTVNISNTMVSAPFPPVSGIRKTPKGIESYGYLPELLYLLANIMNFKVVNVITQDGQYGSPTANGSWIGLIGTLQRKEADITAASLSFNKERNPIIDFTLSLYTDEITLTVKKPAAGGSVNVWAYMKTFSIGPWIVVGMSTGVLALALTLIKKAKVEGKDNVKKFSFINSLGMIFISLLQRDPKISRRKSSTHILIFVISMYFFMAFAYFSAVLTSYMTVLEQQVEINSFEDVLRLDYHMVTMKGSSTDTILKQAKPPSVFYRIYEKDMKHNPESFIVTLEGLLAAVRDNPKTGLFGLSAFAYGQQDLLALNLPDAIFSYHSMGLQKNSEFTQIFNYYLLKIQQCGIMAKVKAKWFNEAIAAKSRFDSESEIIILAYDNLIFPFLVLISGFILSLIGAILEFILKKF